MKNYKDFSNQIFIAREYLDKQRYPSAEAILTDILAQEPQNVEVRYLIAFLYKNTQRVDQAETIFKELVSSYYGMFALKELGWIKITQGNYPVALGYFTKLIEKHPQYAQGYSGSALCKCYLNKEYNSFIDKALELDPDDIDVLLCKYYILNYKQYGTFAERKVLEKLFDTSLSRDFWYNLLYRTETKDRNPDKQVEALKKSLEYNPVNQTNQKRLKSFKFDKHGRAQYRINRQRQANSSSSSTSSFFVFVLFIFLFWIVLSDQPTYNLPDKKPAFQIQALTNPYVETVEDIANSNANLSGLFTLGGSSGVFAKSYIDKLESLGLHPKINFMTRKNSGPPVIYEYLVPAGEFILEANYDDLQTLSSFELEFIPNDNDAAEVNQMTFNLFVEAIILVSDGSIEEDKMMGDVKLFLSDKKSSDSKIFVSDNFTYTITKNKGVIGKRIMH